MKKETVILLLSGGIDSTTLLAKLVKENYEIICLSFNYNQRNKLELELACNNTSYFNVKKHIIIDVPKNLFESSALVNNKLDINGFNVDSYGNKRINSYVPFRNLVFSSLALSKAESLGVKKVFIAVNKDDSEDYWDCRPSFFKQLNLLTESSSNIKIKTPFINYSKREIIEIANQLCVNLDNTISCYQPVNNQECGECLSCRIKEEALA
ncbi:7-cyano-7-deazaguanine synthase QueC [uncultured Lutibacter sp.]|uniref:7-cyano-7-deazaguanine synthase QueC n=1 Tax=uncultured Lutibacter sp. TaxID=437739 RepID=UPI00261ECFCE|nr:7-cyano-7-deazaguanine synthase QueC [uncultured Lutibacter sp.]